MRRPSSSTTVLLVAGVFWGLVAGLLPYPALMIAFGIDVGPVLTAFASYPIAAGSWLVPAAATAGCIGFLLSSPFQGKRHIHWLLGLMLWVGTGLVALGAGQAAGLIVNGWVLQSVSQQPLRLRDAQTFLILATTLLDFGILPILTVGLVSYPVFAHFRRGLRLAGPA